MSNDDSQTDGQSRVPSLSRRQYMGTLAALLGTGSAVVGAVGSNSEITTDPLSGDKLVQPNNAVEGALDLAGPLADRPDPDVVPEQYYAVTDAGSGGSSMKLTYSDGSSWSEVPIAAPAIDTEQSTIGVDPAYPYISESATVLDVPNDYSTIQEAIDALPRRLHHQHVIDISTGTYDEDLLVERIQNLAFIEGNIGTGSAGENTALQIIGDTTTPSNVKVNSATVIGCVGKAVPQFWGIQWQGKDNPYNDDSYCVGFHGPQGEGFLGDCELRANASNVATQAVLAYGGKLHVRDTDFGSNEFEDGLVAKRQGRIHSRNLIGSVTGAAYRNKEFSDQYIQDGGLSGDLVVGQGGEIRRDGALNYQHDSDRRGHQVELTGTDQTVSPDTWTTVEFNNVAVSDFGSWDSGTYQWTCPEYGVYNVDFSIMYLSVPSGTEIYSQIYTNGGSQVEHINTNESTAATQSMTSSSNLQLAPGDTVEIRARHNAGSAVDLNAYAPGTYMAVNKL